MNNQILTVSPSPHVYGKENVNKIMYGVIIAMIPALAVSFLYFGLSAILVTLISVFFCVSFEWLIQKYILKNKPSITDGSAIITGMLLAFNVPSSIPWWMVMVGSLMAIGVAKMSFGGLGNNPFNPALVGRVFMLISFPVDMTSWPKPSLFNMNLIDAQTGATPLAVIKEGVKNGQQISDLMSTLPSYFDMFIGQMGGSLGEISAISLIIGGIYMLMKKIISWHIPVAMLGSMIIFSGILNIINPEVYVDPMFHILTGGAMLGAIFMATDMVTSPMHPTSMLIFGAGIGILTILIRVFGAYPEGVSFAILIMNAFVPLLNKIKPKRFGRVKSL